MCYGANVSTYTVVPFDASTSNSCQLSNTIASTKLRVFGKSKVLF